MYRGVAEVTETGSAAFRPAPSLWSGPDDGPHPASGCKAQMESSEQIWEEKFPRVNGGGERT